MKFTIACVLLTLVYEATSTSTTLSLRGKNRDLQENCGSFGTCNVRSTCTATGCVCKDGFVEPPDCRDLDECTELDDPPCQFEGVVCVDMDPNLDGSSGGKYKCACRTKDGYEDGPVSNEFGPTSCVFVGSGMTDDPCASAPCHPDATCAPSGATFTCTCTGDLVGDGTTDCSPPDDGAPCASANDCADNPNSFCSEELKKCVCEEGFFQGAGAGGQCEPENFCTLGPHDCDVNADCQPLLGDAARGFFTCKCKSGYTDSTEPNIQVGRKCVPHDECSDGSHGCDDATEACVNLEPPLTNVCINKTLAPVTVAPVEQIAVTPAPAPLPFCQRTNCIVPQSFCAAESSACSCVAGTSGDALSLCLDENLITPDTIFGSGNNNGGFTIGRGGGVEVGLRAKVRYDYKNRPTERSLEFAFDGKRTYKFYKGTPSMTMVGIIPATPSPLLARWNFDWSVNSDYDDVSPSGKKLDAFTYALSLGFFDSSNAGTFQSDNIAATIATVALGNSFGDSATGNSDGEEAADLTEYAALLAGSSVVQNSFNYGFTLAFPAPFNTPAYPSFNNQLVGTYTIGLQALDMTSGDVVAESSIDVEICDDEVTPDTVFGTGNSNGGFTTTRSNAVELGLRGKWRFDNPMDGTDPYRFNSDGTYDFPAGNPIEDAAGPPVGPGFNFAPGAVEASKWNFDWSINTNYDSCTTGGMISDYTFLMTTSFNGVMWREFDPIYGAPDGTFPDHEFGDNGSSGNDGTKASTLAEYTTFTETKNLVQNSWNTLFGDVRGNAPFDASTPGTFVVSLKAFKDGVEVAAVSITIFTTAP